MAMKRTGKVQTEKTETGIITTAEEKGHVKGQKRTRWAQVGFTSTRLGSDGKLIADGPFGQPLVDLIDAAAA